MPGEETPRPYTSGICIMMHKSKATTYNSRLKLAKTTAKGCAEILDFRDKAREAGRQVKRETVANAGTPFERC